MTSISQLCTWMPFTESFVIKEPFENLTLVLIMAFQIKWTNLEIVWHSGIIVHDVHHWSRLHKWTVTMQHCLQWRKFNFWIGSSMKTKVREIIEFEIRTFYPKKIVLSFGSILYYPRVNGLILQVCCGWGIILDHDDLVSTCIEDNSRSYL